MRPLRSRLLGVRPGRSGGAVLAGEREHLSSVERAPSRLPLFDLAPAREAARDDQNYAYAAAWEFRGVGLPPVLNKEPLTFDYVHPSQRSYK